MKSSYFENNDIFDFEDNYISNINDTRSESNNHYQQISNTNSRSNSNDEEG